MSKARDIEIMKHKVDEINIKLNNFIKYNISGKKIENLKILKLKYEDQLAELEYE